MSEAEIGGGVVPWSAPLVMVEETGSTNDVVRELAQAGAVAGTAVSALVQTAGRGRRGHGWVSPRGNLYLSVLLRPSVPMQYFMGLSVVCSLGVLRALRDDLSVEGVALKWPNDLLLDDRGKLGGVLVEAGSSADGLYAVCGVGLNVEPCDEADERLFDSPLPLKRACLTQALPVGASFDMGELARIVRDRIVEAVDEWVAAVAAGGALAGPLMPVLDAYANDLALLGRFVAVFDPEGRPLGSGTFAGIDGWGRATIRLTDGQAVDYSAEQVSLRPVSDNYCGDL